MLRVEIVSRAGRYRVLAVTDEATGEVLKSGMAVDITWHQRGNLSPTLTVRVDGQPMRIGRDISIIIRHVEDIDEPKDD